MTYATWQWHNVTLQQFHIIVLIREICGVFLCYIFHSFQERCLLHTDLLGNGFILIFIIFFMCVCVYAMCQLTVKSTSLSILLFAAIKFHRWIFITPISSKRLKKSIWRCILDNLLCIRKCHAVHCLTFGTFHFSQVHAKVSQHKHQDTVPVSSGWPGPSPCPGPLST